MEEKRKDLLVEFAYNNSLHVSTGVTPFRFSISLPSDSVNPSAEDLDIS
jgi:hypothetical protein